jgi:hypothetical protein
LGPSDVEQCPEFDICKRVVAELKRSHWYSIAGQPGCGKSITAWQTSKKFHDAGYSVWRPRYNANAEDLLKEMPPANLSFLVIDDAQQFGASFVERLSEYSCETRKVLLASTLANIVTQNPSLISPKAGVDKLKISVLERRDEILPIVQRFDDRVSDRYMDIPFERRVEDCGRQKSPWEFFWMLRGGWKTAKAEYEGLKQVANANILLTTIALRQISSCDAGIPQEQLYQLTERMGLKASETDRVISHLVTLGLILISDDIFRTKHLSYANRIVEESLHIGNFDNWSENIDIIVYTTLDKKTSSKGIYWLLCTIQWTDAARHHHGDKFRTIFEPLMKRCRQEWPQNEWAIGCASALFNLFKVPIGEILADEELLLRWFTSGTGMAARFCSDIANHLINESDKDGFPETTGAAKCLFDKINV